jgi:hypothetical protein
VSKQCGRDERRAVKRWVDVCTIGLLKRLLIGPFAPLNVSQLPNRIQG